MGGKNDEVFVIDLKNPQAATIFSPNSSREDSSQQNIGRNQGSMKQTGQRRDNGTGETFVETTCVAWNSQVVHVLTSGSSNGVLNVWDLRQKTAWCTLRDSRGSGR